MEKLKKILLPTHADSRGDLTVLELKDYVDWTPKRIYYVTSTKNDRGGHAVRGERKIYICMQGSMKGRFHDGEKWQRFQLQGPGDAILVNGLCWREFTDFSDGSVLMGVSNMNYEPESYIFNMDEFLNEAST